MATEKISGDGGTILAAGDPLIVELISDAGGDAKPGLLVQQTAETTCGVTQRTKSMGVAMESEELDIDSVFAQYAVVRIVLLGCGCIVRSFMDQQGSASVYVGNLVITGCSTSGTWDLAGTMTNSDISLLVGRVGRFDATTDGSLKVGWLMLSI